MQGSNQVTLSGAITKDPTLSYTPAGLAIMNIDVGGVSNVGDRRVPFYQRATLFGKYAETLAEKLPAGTPVFILGRLTQRSYDDKNGKRGTSVDLVVDRLIQLEPEGLSFHADSRNQDLLENAVHEVILAGNATRDAELRHTNSGAAVARIGMAVNSRYRNASGKETESVAYFDVEGWDAVANAMSPMVKSMPLIVQGRIKNSSYTDKDGDKRYTTTIEAFNILAAAAAPTGSGAQPARPARTQQAAAGGTAAVAERPRLDIDEEFPPEEDLPF